MVSCCYDTYRHFPAGDSSIGGLDNETARPLFSDNVRLLQFTMLVAHGAMFAFLETTLDCGRAADCILGTFYCRSL